MDDGNKEIFKQSRLEFFWLNNEYKPDYLVHMRTVNLTQFIQWIKWKIDASLKFGVSVVLESF